MDVDLKDCFSPLVEWKKPEVARFTSLDNFRKALKITQCSVSKPVTLENCAKLVLNKAKLKQHCRNGVHPAARKRIWLDAVGVNDADSVLLAKAFGEPQEDHELAAGEQIMTMGLTTDLACFPSFHLRLSCFNPGMERVLRAIYYKFIQERQSNNMDVEVHAPLTPILVYLMLHFIDEWEVFALLSHLFIRTGWLDQNKSECDASHFTFISLLKSHANSTLDALKHLKPVAMTQQVFLDELTTNWFLWPFYQQPFWIAVRVLDMFFIEGPKVLYRLALSALKLFSSVSQNLEPGSVITAVQMFLCSMSFQQKGHWFRNAFAIPRLSWLHILREWKSHLPAPNSVNEVDGVDQESIDSVEEKVIPDPSSELIESPELWPMIWEWLPEWIFCKEPMCIFRASRDGYNLRTLYRRCEHYPHVLLFIKSSSGRIFGAFIATELSERHNAQFFGNGESFLFSLSPEVQCYKWTAETDLILRANDHELIVGSGGGAYGLWLDSELNQGGSSTCTAFKNPPLCGSERQFTCTSIEVYSCSNLPS